MAVGMANAPDMSFGHLRRVGVEPKGGKESFACSQLIHFENGRFPLCAEEADSLGVEDQRPERCRTGVLHQHAQVTRPDIPGQRLNNWLLVEERGGEGRKRNPSTASSGNGRGARFSGGIEKMPRSEERRVGKECW